MSADARGHDAQSTSAVRGLGFFNSLERLLGRFDGLVSCVIPPGLNPLLLAGPVANICFGVALFSGILLLVWYRPSIFEAYESLEALKNGSILGQYCRSIHRYSSDAFVFFIIVHAVRIFVMRKFLAARWLPWVTGWMLLGLVWFIGWLGFCLVWDVQAQLMITEIARLADVLPIFPEPVQRMVLADGMMPSLLFFIIFFAHMLLPLAFAVGIWIHISRMSRPKLFPSRKYSLGIILILSAWSLAVPAYNGAPADLSAQHEQFQMDVWYAWPLAITEHFSAGAVWVLGSLGGVALLTVPWTFARKCHARAQKSHVHADKCYGCTFCEQDCPFGAITMVKDEREEGRSNLIAEVDESICMGCGICAGSCNTGAIGLDDWDIREERAMIEKWIERESSQGNRPYFAFVCGGSAAASLNLGLSGAEVPELEGYQVRVLPCSGWLNPRLLDVAIKKGAGGILVAGCGSGEPMFRDGADLLEQRLTGHRKPLLRRDSRESGVIEYVRYDKSDRKKLMSDAKEFRDHRRIQITRNRIPVPVRQAANIAAGIVIMAFVGWLSQMVLSRPVEMSPEWIVSFKHRGEPEYMDLSKWTSNESLVHMKPPADVVSSYKPVLMKIIMDGSILLSKTVEASGLSNDGVSVALERLKVEEGPHLFRVELYNSPEAEVPGHVWEETVHMVRKQKKVLMFDTDSGFRLFPEAKVSD